jgi:putative ABC transport system substrate-binding protein
VNEFRISELEFRRRNMHNRFLLARALSPQSAIRYSKFAILLGAMLFALCPFAVAQQAKRMPRIGYLSVLSPSSDAARFEAFREGLRELGYVAGQSIAIERRYTEGKLDRLSALAGELVGLNVDVIVAGGSTAIRATKKATGLIPIVMAHGSDPVALGYVASLARPGGNITGLTHLAPELGGKRLELLKDMIAQLTRVAVLTDPGTGGHGPQIKELEVAAPALRLQLQVVAVRAANELESAFSVMTQGRAGAFIGLQQPTLDRIRDRIVELAARHRLPGMHPNDEYVEAGGLMSYAADIVAMFRRTSTYVDKILKGARPADLPVEQPTKFELVINLKTAKQIGLTIPPNVLARADRVIK